MNFVERCDDEGTLMPSRDRSLNCSLNVALMEGGRGKFTQRSFLEVWVDGGGALTMYRDTDSLQTECSTSYSAEEKAVCDNQKIILIFILETYG